MRDGVDEEGQKHTVVYCYDRYTEKRGKQFFFTGC